MKKLYFHFFLFICFSSLAQLDNRLNNYYQLVNTAEINIVDNKINDAYANYKKAFKMKEIPFGLDQHNFAVCCAKLKKERESFKYIQFLIEYGYIKDSLLNNKELNYLKKPKWQKKINSTTKIQNTKYKISLDSLFIMDQKFRKIDKIKYKDSIFKIDSLNAISMIKLKNKYACFSETYIGLDQTPLSLILMHNFQVLSKRGDITDLSNLLYDCVQTGAIDIRFAAFYLQGYGKINLGDGMGSGIVSYGYVYIENGKETLSGLSKPGFIYKPINNELNTARKNMGLCSIEEYRKKIIFNYKNNSFKFINSLGKNNVFFSKKEDYDKAIGDLIFFE
jgi:hypothetical protein